MQSQQNGAQASSLPNSGTSPLPGKAKPTGPVVLTGNPNSGKTTVFNALTGLRARVGNYAGVTVERKEGRLQGSPASCPITVLDLPGTYSLSPQSLDEQIARDVLFHRLKEVEAPSLVVVVVDASNLERNLYFATQVIELGYPVFIALNMVDVARDNGQLIDAAKLSEFLGVPVLPLSANCGEGIPELREKIIEAVRHKNKLTHPHLFCQLPESLAAEIEPLADLLAKSFKQRHTSAHAEALLVLSDDRFISNSGSHYPLPVQTAVRAARERLERAAIDWRSVVIEARYNRISHIRQTVTTQARAPGENFTDKFDRIATHKLWGLLMFVAIMGLMFLGIFVLAKLPMNLIQDLVSQIGAFATHQIPPGDLQNLIVRGIIQGVGAVVVFLPQICLLFLFIGLLEDTGYMARAAFLMDRLMSKAGLHGKSFIPMLSSFACAIPGIMATRTIETPKDRLVTILIAPLMSCSARLPVYILLIAACFPDRPLMASATMLSMYLLGIIMALIMACLFKKILFRGDSPVLILELPPYKRPLAKVILHHMWDRAKLFLQKAGTVILGINILLWFLATYPKHEDIKKHFAEERVAVQTASTSKPNEITPAQQARLDSIDTAESGEGLRRSFAGLCGRAIEPIIAPLGFDWKIGIGLVSSFAAREIFVSTMAIVYNVGGGNDEKEHTQALAQIMRQEKRPDGTLVYTTLTTITLLIFYVLALQCVSTIAVVRRETNSWKWAAFQWIYMALLAWGCAFLTYQGGKLLGFG